MTRLPYCLFVCARTIQKIIINGPINSNNSRGVHGKEFDEWVGSLHSILQSSDRGPGCLTLLRQLYVLTATTKYNRRCVFFLFVFSTVSTPILVPRGEKNILYTPFPYDTHTHSLTTDIYRLLQSVVLEPEQGSTRVRLLASAVIRDLSPSKHIVINDFNPPVESRNIPYILPVLLSQTNVRERLSLLAPTIVR